MSKRPEQQQRARLDASATADGQADCAAHRTATDNHSAGTLFKFPVQDVFFNMAREMTKARFALNALVIRLKSMNVGKRTQLKLACEAAAVHCQPRHEHQRGRVLIGALI